MATRSTCKADLSHMPCQLPAAHVTLTGCVGESCMLASASVPAITSLSILAARVLMCSRGDCSAVCLEGGLAPGPRPVRRVAKQSLASACASSSFLTILSRSTVSDMALQGEHSNHQRRDITCLSVDNFSTQLQACLVWHACSITKAGVTPCVHLADRCAYLTADVGVSCGRSLNMSD